MPQNHAGAARRFSRPRVLSLVGTSPGQRTGAARVLSGPRPSPGGPESDRLMSRYLGPKVKLSRRVQVPIADIPKHTGKDLTLPGMHGFRGRRSTEYGIRLIEKQKLR